MPELFSNLMRLPSASLSPTPFTPEMEQEFNKWRTGEIVRWVNQMKALNSGGQIGVANPETAPKLRSAIEYYQTDSPTLRQEFLQRGRVVGLVPAQVKQAGM